MPPSFIVREVEAQFTNNELSSKVGTRNADVNRLHSAEKRGGGDCVVVVQRKGNVTNVVVQRKGNANAVARCAILYCKR